MTNEELVKEVQAGINVKENMEVLYTNNINFIRWLINRTLKSIYIPDSEMEDMLQSAYISLDKAVKQFDFNREVKFLTYYEYHIKTQLLRKDIKYSTKYEKNKPIRLDSPKSNDPENESSLIDYIQDEEAVKAFKKIEDDEYSIKMWKTVKESLKDSRMYEILEKKHKNLIKRAEIMSELNLSSQKMRELEVKAHYILKRSKRFKPYIEDYWTILAYRNVTITSFRTTHTSSTERAAMQKLSDDSFKLMNDCMNEVNDFLNYYKDLVEKNKAETVNV